MYTIEEKMDSCAGDARARGWVNLKFVGDAMAKMIRARASLMEKHLTRDMERARAR
jgi:hypothetical protein